MYREQDSTSRCISRARGHSSIPTSLTTPSRPCSATSSTNTRISSIVGRHRLPEVHMYETQPKDSLTSSTEVVVEEPTSPNEGVIFLSLTGEQLL